jgi:hypothetical protein
MKFILLFVIIHVMWCKQIVVSSQWKQEWYTLKEKLAQEYCPWYDLHGKAYCPYEAKWESIHVHIRGAGIGYNRITKRLAFPVLQTDSNIYALDNTRNKVYRFTDTSAFLNILEGNEILGGVFGESTSWLDSFLSSFGDYTGDMTITQSEYHTHKTNCSKKQYTKEFNALLQLLPDVYDANNQTHVYLFSMLFEFFGTGIALEAYHGGMVYRQSMVKKCFGENFEEASIKELERDIQHEPREQNVYARYRKVGLLDIKGGNPEIQDTQERTRTFALAPAILSFTYQSLDQVAPEKPSIKQALQDYYARNEDKQWRMALEERIKQEQLKQWLKPLPIRVYMTYPEDSSAICPHRQIGWQSKYTRCFVYSYDVTITNSKFPSFYIDDFLGITEFRRNNITGDISIKYPWPPIGDLVTTVADNRYYHTSNIWHFVFDCEPGCKYTPAGLQNCEFVCNCKGY